MKKAIAIAIWALASGLLIGVSVHAYANEQPKVTICHATASETNPYVVETVDESSIVQSFDGHGYSGVNSGDIIPPFTYNGGTYPGQGDQSFLSNGCHKPDPTTVPPPSTTTTQPPSPTVPPTTIAPPTTTTPPNPSVTPPTTSATAPAVVVVPTPSGPTPVVLGQAPAGTLKQLPFTGSGTGTWILLGIGSWLIFSGLAALWWVRRFGHRNA